MRRLGFLSIRRSPGSIQEFQGFGFRREDFTNLHQICGSHYVSAAIV